MQAYRQARGNPPRAYIYMTAASCVISPALAQQLDALHVRVLRKPFDLDQLVAMIGAAAARLPER